MNAISGIGGANGAWPQLRSARADAVFSLTDADGGDATSVEDVTPPADIEDDGSLSASELDNGLQDLMPPTSTLDFAHQYGENDLTMPTSGNDDGSDAYGGLSAGDTSNDGSSADASVDQALNTLVDLVMQQYGQRDASSNDAIGGSLSVSA